MRHNATAREPDLRRPDALFASVSVLVANRDAILKVIAELSPEGDV